MRFGTICKIYFHTCLIVIGGIGLLGFACPFLISQNDWVAALSGVVLLLLVPVFGFVAVRAVHKDIKQLQKERHDVQEK